MDNKSLRHTHISADHRLLDIRLGELWQYRDLALLFTRRSVIVTYKQTILGPLWLIINPLLTSLVYMFVFGGIAGIGTDGVPSMLFYLAGTAIWNYFSSNVRNCSGTFIDNVNLFGKVYFPRLVMPISNVLAGVVKFCIQMIPVLILIVWYGIKGSVHPQWYALIVVPLTLLQLGLLGMGTGIIISSLTTRYRDLRVLVDFGLTLWMYATPVVYPLSEAPSRIAMILTINPVTAPAELFRQSLLGTGTVTAGMLAASWAVTIAIALIGLIIFSKVERDFIDTV